MADAKEASGNPFSFKTFVKSKQETKDPKHREKQEQKNSDNSPVNRRKGDNVDESPFPDVKKQGKRFQAKNVELNDSMLASFFS